MTTSPIEVNGRPISDIYKELRALLRHNEALEAKLDYFQISARWRAGTETAPTRHRFLACYAVTGGSEGHYVHVDLLVDEGNARNVVWPLFTGKTFEGMGAAQEVAAFCAEALGA